MAYKQGLVTINNDPYLYQENQTVSSFTVSAATGINTSAGDDNEGTFVICVSPDADANPSVTFPQVIIEPVTGTITLQPGLSFVNVNGPLAVANIDAYKVVCGGTANGAQLQTVATLGTAGQVLTSNGAAALPTWQSAGEVIAYTGITNADSPYTVLSTDFYISCDVTGGVITVELPDAPSTGRVFVIKDKVGLAATSNITITTVGGAVNIDGGTSYVINTNYQAVEVIFNGTSYEVF